MKRTLEIDFDTIERVIPSSSKRVKFMQQVKEYNDMINGKGKDELKKNNSDSELDKNELDGNDESGNIKIQEGKPYNSFVKERFNDVKELNPELTNQDIFRLLAIEWKSSSMNPKND
ncbi:16867_t:CDS:2, partial [Acaulospora morrowiae]